jgi:hypothetical protein
MADENNPKYTPDQTRRITDGFGAAVNHLKTKYGEDTMKMVLAQVDADKSYTPEQVAEDFVKGRTPAEIADAIYAKGRYSDNLPDHAHAHIRQQERERYRKNRSA